VSRIYLMLQPISLGGLKMITCLQGHLTRHSSVSACFSRRYLRWRTVLTVATCVAAFVYAFHLMMPLMADALATQPALADTRNGLANIGTSGLISTLLFFQVCGLHKSVSHGHVSQQGLLMLLSFCVC